MNETKKKATELAREEEDRLFFDYLQHSEAEDWESWPREKMLMKRRNWEDERHLQAQAEMSQQRLHDADEAMAQNSEQRIIGTISMMQLYILTPAAQEKACKDLAVLCRLHDEENGSFAIRQGVLSHVLTAIQAYPSSQGIQKEATAVLRHLAGPSHSMEMCLALKRAPVLLRTLEASLSHPVPSCTRCMC